MENQFLLWTALLATIPFLSELFVGTLLFSIHFERRKPFSVRLLASLALEIGLSYIILIFCWSSESWLLRNTFFYLLLFILSLIMPFLCFKEHPAQLILCAVSGYMTQHIGSQVIQMMPWRESVHDVEMTLSQLTFVFLSEFLIFIPIALLLYFLFARRTTYAVYSGEAEKRMFWLSIITLIVILVLSSVRDNFASESYILMVISRLLSIFCCFFLLYLRSDILEKSRMEFEQEELRRLYELQREQYEQNRENIELINIKCHDLKRRIGQLENNGGKVNPEEIREVKQLINIYDSTVKTGCQTLDTILTERSLYCEKHGIRLSCMVDGEKLSFMMVGDICALFGNALENAIEAVSKLQNEEDRLISFQVRESKGMLIITIDNYFSGSLEFENGLPRTTKGDESWHGYGMKSIRHTAEKYGGEANVLIDDMFHLSVLLPVPNK